MDLVLIEEKIKALNLPAGQYVVFGSGPLAAHGIRDTRDVDLFITTELYKTLKTQGWEEKEWPRGGKYLTHDIFEADDSWEYGNYNPSPEEIIEKAEFHNDVPYAPLEEVLKWKRAFGREKDLRDVELIENHLSSGD